jgi:6-phosphofructokinase 1
VVFRRVVKEATDPIRLGGIGFELGHQIEELTGIVTRTVVMGHLQRGGTPTPFDRVLATRLGTKAVDMIEMNTYGYMAGVQGNSLVEVSLDEVVQGQRTIPPNDPLIRSARSLATCFGD